MRKLLLTGVTALAITAGGCTTTQVTSFLSQVQAAAAQGCMFVPTIDTILAIAASLGFSPAVAAGAAVNSVAAAICSKVPPPASAKYQSLFPQGGGPAKTVGSVNGVLVNGWRTH